MMSIYVGLNELSYDDMDTLVFLRSHFVDPKVSLDAPESEPSSKVQMLPRTAQLIDFVFHILSSLSTEEAAALLDHTYLYSSCLNKRTVWNEALQQSCSPYPNDCISSADAGTFAQAPGEDRYEFTAQPVDVAGNSLTTILQPCIENFSIAESLTTSWPGPLDVDNDQVNWNTAPTSSHTLPQDICYSTEKDTSLGEPCATKIQQDEISCGKSTAQFSGTSLLTDIIIFAGPSTPALPIPRTGCTLENKPNQSKLGKRQSPECEIKHRSSLSADTLGIPAHKRRCSSFASADAKPVPPVEELGAAGDALEKDPILPVNKESSTFCPAAHMPHLDQSIINAGDGQLILDNFPEFLAINSASWSLKEAQGQHSLGIPLTKFMSYQSACVAYLKAWEAQPDANKRKQSPLGRFYRRVMHMCFVAFFQGLDQEVNEKDTAGTLTSTRDTRDYRKNCTIARDRIIQEVYGDNITKTQKQKYRQNISDSFLRWGSRWWKMASCIGLGFVLFASEELAIIMGKTNFTEPMVDELINYIVNFYPGLVSLCEEFGPITQSLMIGKGFSSLFEKINDSTLSDRLTKAEQRVQDPPDEWKTVNPELVSVSAANDFLRFRQEYFQKSEAAGSFDNKMSNDTD